MSDLFKRQIRLKSRPDGIPQAEQFELVIGPVPALPPGPVLVRNSYLSGGPAMRGWVAAVANDAEPVAIAP